MPPNTTVGTDPCMASPVVGDPQAKDGGNAPSVRVPGPPQQRPTPDQLRVMVAGESGLGKTTFLNNIFRHLNRGENPMDQAATVVQAAGRGVFGNGKTLRIEEREFDYKTERGQDYKFFLVDTPGYGDHVNVSQSFQPVVNYVMNGNKSYLEEVMKGNETPEKDGRTDVCIYFIAAHRCKPIDIEYMKQLSKAVAVIPVIGKSDSMTVDEMKEFKTAIVDLAAQDDQLKFFQFSETSWNECKGALGPTDPPNWLGERQPPPYAVISSKVDESHRGIRSPARRYPWGTCHVMETAHSDNTYLQCLLLEVGFQDMKKEMKTRYKAFVKEQTRPTTEVTVDAIKRLPRWVAHKVQGRGRKSVLVLISAVVCALVAVVLAHLRCGVNGTPPIEGGGMYNPPESLANWAKVIEKIQKLEGWDRILAAADSGEEHLAILIDVLMEYYKNTELRNKAQEKHPRHA
ncbi:Sept3, septin GTPase [Ectocarpus siliculosus]|uniref:Sept3, septin GTPase n=1 Tax=Ectocarpus siliculosus TaxID=2880 RepID=D7FUI7_ECTSI|nr:Sept3, septin GTPase [Ectocarpus siliculosus]|eukprot:CBJ31643.1 Sept3, septin GTPase [Ectocarpus siliculosus]